MTLGPVMVDLAGIALEPEERDMLRHPQVGSVILFTRNYESPDQLARLVAEIHALRTPALLVAVDQEGGRVQRFREGFTRLPPLREIGRRYASDRGAGLALARELGWLMAAELRAVGVDMSFAPCVDLDYGVSSVIGDRALHADAAAVGELAVAYMLGMRDAGMAATAKHFPGHGAVAADSHVASPVDRRAWPDIEADLGPYRRLIANGLPSVMVAHVVFPAIDAHPASLSRALDPRHAARRPRIPGRGVCGRPVDGGRRGLRRHRRAGATRARRRLRRAAGLQRPRRGTCLLDALREAPDPVSPMRLARLHGRDAGPAPLDRDPRWQAAVAAARSLVDRPALQLEGDRPA